MGGSERSSNAPGNTVGQKLGCSQHQVFASKPPPTTGAQSPVLWLGGFFTKAGWRVTLQGSMQLLALFWWDRV